MMKKLLAGFLEAVSAFALTTVTGTVNDPLGVPINGKAFIELSGTCLGPTGAVIVNEGKIVTITGGALSVALEPSMTCNPAQYYKVTYSSNNWNSQAEMWNVPDSPTPVTIASVRISQAPVTGTSIGISTLTGGVTKGDMIAYTGTLFSRVPAGTNGYCLVRDDAQANGVAWNACGTGGGGPGDPNMVTALGTLTANLPVIGTGTKTIGVGTRSGNTTQFGTVTGTKTVSKQLAFDASGNIIASATDIGAGGGGPDPNAVTATSTFGNDNRLLRSDGPGRLAQSSGVTVDDTDLVTAPGGFSSTTSGTGFFEGAKGTTPATPATDKLRLFWDASKVLKDVDDAGAVRTIALTTSNVATATALAANGANCSPGNYPLGVDATGAVETCTAIPGADPNMVTAAGTLTSNLPIFGSGTKAVATGTRSGNTTEVATVTGTKTVSKQLAFDASGNVIASASDIGAMDPNTVTAAGTLTSNAPMIGAGSKAAAVGTRSGNTTEFGTITGTKTVSKQLAFDANGNIIASATDIGAGGITGLTATKIPKAATSTALDDSNLTQSATTGAITFGKSQDGPLNTITFSATPTLDLSLANQHALSLTGDVTSWTVSNAPTASTSFTLTFTQDATGGRTVAAPTGFVGFDSPDPTPSAVTVQQFDKRGSSYYGSPSRCVSNCGTGYMELLKGATPATPPTNYLRLGWNASKVLQDVDDAGNVRSYTPGGGTGLDPFDPSVWILYEDFIEGASVALGAFSGTSSFRSIAFAGASGSIATGASSVGHPGIFITNPGVTSGRGVMIHWQFNNTHGQLAMSSVTFDTYWIWSMQTSITNQGVYTGLISAPEGNAGTLNSGCWIRKLATDTNFQCVCSASGLATVTDYGLPPVAGKFYRTHVFSTSPGFIKFKIYEDGVAFGTEKTISSNVSTLNLEPFYLHIGNGNSVNVAVDRFARKQTGITNR